MPLLPAAVMEMLTPTTIRLAEKVTLKLIDLIRAEMAARKGEPITEAEAIEALRTVITAGSQARADEEKAFADFMERHGRS